MRGPARPAPSPNAAANGHTLDVGGQYQYRKEGEYHLFNPETVHKLQYACRTGNYKVFKEYSKLVNDQATRLCTLRGLLELKFADDSRFRSRRSNRSRRS